MGSLGGGTFFTMGVKRRLSYEHMSWDQVQKNSHPCEDSGMVHAYTGNTNKPVPGTQIEWL